MGKKNKIAIAIGSVVVLASASGIYLSNKQKNYENILNNEDKTIVQNIKDNSESKQQEESNRDNITSNDELILTDNKIQNNSTNSNIGNSNESGSNSGEGSQTQGGSKNPGTSGGSSQPSTSEKPGESTKPSIPNDSTNPSTPQTPDESEKPSTPETPGESGKPSTPETPGGSEEPESPEAPNEPEIVVTNLTITEDDLVDGVVTISNKTYKNIFIDSSVVNGKVVLDNVEIQEKLTLQDGVQYQVQINNSKVPYVKVENKEVKRYRNASLNINKNISGPTLYLENVEEINKVDINGNVSIYGDSEISNLSLLNGTLLLDIPTKIMNIDENSIYADVTINKKVNQINDGGNSTSIGINDNVDKVNLNGKKEQYVH